MCSIFSCFPRLPLELRRKIFGITIEQPRKVLIDLKTHGPDIVLGARAPIPSIMLTCKESREEALRTYTRDHQYFSSPQFDQNLYINLETDTLVFAKADVLALFFQHTSYLAQIQIRSMSFRSGPSPTHYMSDFSSNSHALNEYASRCRKLDEFTVMVECSELLPILNSPYCHDGYLNCWPKLLKSVFWNIDIEKRRPDWKRPKMKIEIWAGWERPVWERPDWGTLEQIRRSWAEARGSLS